MRIIAEENEEKWKPMNDVQWKCGRSAKELFKYANSPEFKEHIPKIINECVNINDEIEYIELPEQSLPLGKGMKKGGLRKTDLLLRSNAPNVYIEAKVSEPFGEPINKIIAKNGGQADRAKVLLDFLCPNHKAEAKEYGIGYQLFTATRSAIWDARSIGRCIVLIIVFEGNIEHGSNYKKNCEKNEKDFEHFLEVVEADRNGKIEKTIENSTVTCWIKKIRVNIGNTYTIL